MCGVIGLVYEKLRPDLGRVASSLLKTLEYRGYDSTGAAIQGDSVEVDLRKGVGAPSALVSRLGIEGLSGRVFVGQVRWATFGAVTEANAQPHVVRCKTFLYGAHNGNVTNCDALKTWLSGEGHDVVSDNDGEMVVHAVEHFFARELAGVPELSRLEPEVRKMAMRRAIVEAGRVLEGSFAAAIADPITRTLWAVKAGSSLYFGVGADPVGGRFSIASSDLSSVLKLTRAVVPLSEGEFVEFTSDGYQVYALAARALPGRKGVCPGDAIDRPKVRSRLRVEDTVLSPRFQTFMEQEIAAQPESVRQVISLFLGGSEAARTLSPCLSAVPKTTLGAIGTALDALRDQCDDEELRRGFFDLVDGPAMGELLEAIPTSFRALGVDVPQEKIAESLASADAGFLADLLGLSRGPGDLLAVRVLDGLLEREEADQLAEAVSGFTARCLETVDNGGNLYVVCCGSSFHAAKAACLFFNTLAGVELIPILPGEFRGQYAQSLADGDLIISVSQSGETKDLIDVLNDVAASGKKISRVALVNNVNSTLAEEKSDLVVPLRCGPEIAVPATKSFMGQMAVLYCLAISLAEARGRSVVAQRQSLDKLPGLVREALETTEESVERAARLLYLAPSVHILATRLAAVAKEGALKIREVVLNHTEGFEGSEFKHGPNTILGFNTIFGPTNVAALLDGVGEAFARALSLADSRGLGAESRARLGRAVATRAFSPMEGRDSLSREERECLELSADGPSLVGLMYADYPLVYVTGPDERDVALTVSQMNTHKIRGAATVVVAEESERLRGAAEKAPADNPRYASVYISLPPTGDTILTAFSATAVLQRLALRMSLLKMAYLDGIGVRDHGVHPDVPKNVSKSITVD